MINCDFKGGKGLHLEGDLADVSAECILIMRCIYKKNVEEFGEDIAQGLLTRMLVKAIVENVTKEDFEWIISQEKEKEKEKTE